MKKQLLLTGDGSYTLHLPKWNEQYHSKHGALQEALHVFIKEGIAHFINTISVPEVNILEMGFGTGLNALLTHQFASQNNIKIYYTGVEAYPLEWEVVQQLNYTKQLQIKDFYFQKIHQASWVKPTTITPNFTIHKQKKFFLDIEEKDIFHLIYFDAFGIRVQPECWTSQLFSKLYQALKSNGVLVTYAANGPAKRALLEVGFRVEKLKGPPGKREMLRATK